MTIKELIAQLQQYPSTHRVIINGYEGGFNDVAIVQPKRIALDVNTDLYYGDHEEFDSSEHDPSQLTHAILLKR